MSKMTKRGLLESFTDRWGDWNSKPFRFSKESVVLANRYSVLILPYSFEDGELIDFYKHPKAGIILELLRKTAATSMDGKISITSVKEAIEKWPKMSCPIMADCPSCLGLGEVEWFYEFRGQSYELDEICPVCKGSGQSEKALQVTELTDSDFYLKIGICDFHLHRVNEIIRVADFFKVKEITVMSQNAPDKPTRFKIGDAELICASALNTEGQLAGVIEIV